MKRDSLTDDKFAFCVIEVMHGHFEVQLVTKVTKHFSATVVPNIQVCDLREQDLCVPVLKYHNGNHDMGRTCNRRQHQFSRFGILPEYQLTSLHNRHSRQLVHNPNACTHRA